MRYEIYGIGSKAGYLSGYGNKRSLKAASEFARANVRETRFFILEKQRRCSAPFSAVLSDKTGLLVHSVSFLTGADPTRSKQAFENVFGQLL